MQTFDWKIVLIDDEPDVREVLAVILRDAGHEVHAAADGRAGLDLLRKVSPQILITDIRMPGMSGLEVLEAVKRSDPDVEVIVITAFGEMDLAIKALQLDASDFITKPIGDQALELALGRARERYTNRRRLKDYTALLEWRTVETSEELKRTIAYESRLIESSMDGILGVDEHESVVTYNAGMESLTGYPRRDVIGRVSLKDFFQPADLATLREALDSLKYGGKNRLFLYETHLSTRSGGRTPVQVSGTVMTEDGQPEGLVLFFRDLREIRRLEREMADQARILHQDKMTSLGRLAASVVHEINNPLSGILNYARLIRRMLSTGDLDANRRAKFGQYMELVESETERCSRIVSNLLTFSRITPPSSEELNIEELIERSVLLCRHKLELSRIELTVGHGQGIPPVRGDFNQLQQCLINLVFNAVDALAGGGRLEISSSYERAAGRVVIRVKDDGPGIPTEHLPHVFEPFYTTKDEGYGVGLGLSTAYGIVERHGGTIAAESRPGQGATFTIELPI